LHEARKLITFFALTLFSLFHSSIKNKGSKIFVVGKSTIVIKLYEVAGFTIVFYFGMNTENQT